MGIRAWGCDTSILEQQILLSFTKQRTEMSQGIKCLNNVINGAMLVSYGFAPHKESKNIPMWQILLK